jgi:tetrahydromethanopterin S-methyltransferase subunit B
MPSWATFSSTTGRLSGTPTIPGTYSNIVVGVTDGTSRATLAPFNITVSKGSTSGTSTSTALSISGTPPTSATVASAYTFTPVASGPTGQTLRFTILDMPSWGTFNSSTGQLSGTPKVAGTYSNIVIGVTNGTSRVTLPAFTIAVASSGAPLPTGGVTVSWIPPTENTNGTTLTNLAGYHIYYGTSQTNLSHVINITNPGLASYVVSNLSAATWYFSLTSVNSSGVESPRTPVVSHVVQ